jgi:hypothetical protein
LIEREYPSVAVSDGSTTSVTHLSILRKIAINMDDGVGSRDFFITETVKDLAQNRAYIRAYEI